MEKKNAIEKRLEILIDQWNEFAQEDSTCLLRWLSTQDEARMIDVFLESENDAGKQTPDLFLVFDVNFDTPEKYSGALVQSLIEQYEASHKELAEDAISIDWQTPAIDSNKIEPDNFVNQVLSLKHHYSDLLEHLVIAFIPNSISNQKVFLQWLDTLLNTANACELKFMIVDDVSQPMFDDLEKNHPKLVKTINTELDMPGALLEIAQGASRGGPDYKFRCHFIALTNAAEKGDQVAARRAYTSALTVAKEQQWFQMQVVLHMTLGSTFLGAGKFNEALSCYREAEKASENAIQRDDPVGKKLLMQSRFAIGSAFIADGKFEHASEIYEATVPLPTELEEQLMVLECWRMASYCREQIEHYDKAWSCGLQALVVGEELDEETLKTSTLPYVSQGLLRIANVQKDNSGADDVMKKTKTLLGPNWQDSLEGAPEAQ